MSQTGVVAWSQTAATNAIADSNVNWAEGMAPSAVNDSARQEMASVAKYRDDTAGALTTGGTSTAYTLTTNQVFSALSYLDGQELSVKFDQTNGASPTLNVDSLGAKTINLTTGVAVPANFFVAGTPYVLHYNDSTPEFVVKGVAGAIPAGSALTGVATGDKLLIEDVSATALKSVTISELLKIVNVLTADSSPDAAADYVLSYDASASSAKKVLLSSLPAALPRGYIDGLILSNGTDATNDIDIAAGKCRDSTDTVDIILASAVTGKQLDANWAVGSAAGMRDTAAGIANGTYHIYAVRTAASSAGDIYATTQATAAGALTALQAETGGGSYAYARRIGSIMRESASIAAFVQTNDLFERVTPVRDVNDTADHSSGASATLSVPVGIKVRANVIALVTSASGGRALLVNSLSQTSAAPSLTAAPGATAIIQNGTATASGNAWVMTNTSAQVRYRSNNSDADSVIITSAWLDSRGRDA